MKLITNWSVLSLFFRLAVARGSSLPYIGDELGFGVTWRLHEYPYVIIYGTIRLDLDHHGDVEKMPDKKYYSQVAVV